MVEHERLTKEEFCEFICTEPDCWIFEDIGLSPVFWKQNGVAYFDNDKGTLRRFRRMPVYGEVWMSVREYTDYTQFGGKIIWNSAEWSMYSTWNQKL